MPKTGIRDSQAYIAGLINAQVEQGVPASHIFLAGFSQGAADIAHWLKVSTNWRGLSLSSFALTGKIVQKLLKRNYRPPFLWRTACMTCCCHAYLVKAVKEYWNHWVYQWSGTVIPSTTVFQR